VESSVIERKSGKERAVNIQDFETMYIAGLREARGLEERLLLTWPKLAEAAEDRELAEAFRAHINETARQLDSMRAIFDRNSASRADAEDGTLDALLAKVNAIVAGMERGALRDAALISAVQRIEHYQIAVYGTLAEYAKLMGRHDEKRAFGAILEEERAVDADLSDIATSFVNPHAMASKGHGGSKARSGVAA
jgi:ferritin-like metal-binding protein YciE